MENMPNKGKRGKKNHASAGGGKSTLQAAESRSRSN